MARHYDQGGGVDGSGDAQPAADLKHRSETSADFQQGHDDVAAPLSEARAQAAEALDKARSTLGDGIQSASDKARATLGDGMETASNTYDETADSVSSTYSTAATTVSDYSQQASSWFEGGMQQSADVVKMGAAWTMAISGWASDRSQAILETGRAHFASSQDAAFEYMKGCIAAATEYPEITYPALGLAALIILPGPRQFLRRQTLGRLRSEEGMYRSAESKAQLVDESLADQATEAQKLQERLGLAWQEYSSGANKLKSTNRQLQALANRVSKNDAKAQALLHDLRLLPSAPALKLRAQVANTSAKAQRQWSALEKQIYDLSKRGL